MAAREPLKCRQCFKEIPDGKKYHLTLGDREVEGFDFVHQQPCSFEIRGEFCDFECFSSRKKAVRDGMYVPVTQNFIDETVGRIKLLEETVAKHQRILEGLKPFVRDQDTSTIVADMEKIAASK